jgi:hypothetical protein
MIILSDCMKISCSSRWRFSIVHGHVHPAEAFHVFCFSPLAPLQVFVNSIVNRDDPAIVRMIARVNVATRENNFAIAHIDPELLGLTSEDYTGPSLSTRSFRGGTTWKN